MMNEKTINEQYAYIRTLLEEKRLKEAGENEDEE